MNNTLLKKNETAKRDLNRLNIVEVSPIEEKTDVKKQSEPIISNGEMLLTSIYFLAFTVLLMVLKSLKPYKAEKNQIASFKRSNQIPCKNCRFYNHNHYLKCAVHPDAALKAEALNCKDYYPKNNIK